MKNLLLITLLLITCASCKKNGPDEDQTSMKIMKVEFAIHPSSTYGRTDVFEIRSNSRVDVKDRTNYKIANELKINETLHRISHERFNTNSYTITFVNADKEEVSYTYKGE